MKVGPLLPVTSAAKTPVVALTNCRRIRVQEDQSDAGWPVGQYYVFTPTTTDGPMQLAAGSPHTFDMHSNIHWFKTGDIVGYLQMIGGAGSAEFAQYEEP